MMLEDYLKRNATLFSDRTAILSGDRAYTYSELWHTVVERAKRLRGNSVSRFLVMRSSQSAELLIEYFAAHIAGKVAVPLEKDVTDAAVEEIRCMLNRAEDDIPGNVADILFTTGTTGKAKGVMISHETIIADAENLIAAQQYSPDITFVISGPLNHIGSLSKVYPMVYLGGTVSITDGMKDMNTLFAAMENAKGKVATFLVPASIRILMQFGEDRLRGLADKIDFIETGAAPMAQADMQRLCLLLPNSRLYNTYASTETGIIATYDYNAGECIAGCLGVPMRHSQIVVSGDGHISCSGKTLMTGYVDDRKLTESVMYDNAVHTADIGFLDGNGRLHLVGREGDVINVGGYKVPPAEVEDAAMASPSVKDCVCLGVSHPVLGTVLKLLVVLNKGCMLNKREIALAIRERLEAYKVPMLYETVEKVNRTYNGKIDRKSYTLLK